MWTTKRQLREQIADLEAQIERMDKVNTAVSLLKAGAEPDKSFMLELHSDIWPLIAQCLFVWFKESGGKNYVEQTVGFTKETDEQRASMTFKAMDGHMPEMFTITMQRHRGKTPHQLQREAESEAAAWRKRVQELEAAQAVIGGEAHR